MVLTTGLTATRGVATMLTYAVRRTPQGTYQYDHGQRSRDLWPFCSC